MDEARYEVDLDTRKAKADMADLQRHKEGAGRRVNMAARRASNLLMRAAAFTGAAATFGSLGNSAPGGNVDLIGESFVPYVAAAQALADSELGYSAAARIAAREETKKAFAYYVGSTGQTAGMREFYNDVSRIQEEAEAGRNILRQDPRFSGIGPIDALDLTARGGVKVFLENLKSSPFRVLMRGIDYIVEGVQAP